MFFQIQIRSNNFFQNSIQIEDDLSAPKGSAKTESSIMTKKAIPNITQW